MECGCDDDDGAGAGGGGEILHNKYSHSIGNI